MSFRQKKESFIEQNKEALGDVFDGVMDVIDKSLLPISKDDESDNTFTEFCLFILDAFLSKVRILRKGDSDSEPSADESSEEEASLTDQTETPSDSEGMELGSDEDSEGDIISEDEDEDEDDDVELCAGCGQEEAVEFSAFCDDCGQEVDEVDEAPPKKARTE